MALDVDSGQFGFGDFDTAWIARAIEVAGNGESFAGRGGGDSWMMTLWLTSGLPRQFWVM